ncbi:MAG: hypothetical protein J7M32_06795 [Deltaproteobacteria bacterium]|nr:hypothetical protein [Deltaproteobacteria bacterium]
MHAARYRAFLDAWARRCGAPLIMACLLVWTIPAYGSPSAGPAARSLKAAVLVSRNIRPYLEAMEGFKTGLSEGSGTEIQVIGMENLRPSDKAGLVRRLCGENPDLLVGVGPEAALFIWKEIPDNRIIKLYLMVLNPGKVFGAGKDPCGISLNIPVHVQVNMIQKALPDVRRPGIFYDPRINDDFFRKAVEGASSTGITIVPLNIGSKKDIPSVLEKKWNELDAIWMIPDRTVISESIIHYVIKEAFIRKVPVIGFNRFFYDAGAAMAFVFDYETLGRQCAREALRAAAGNPCRYMPPVFDVWINPLVVDKLGLKIPDTYDPPIRLGP